MSNNDWQQTPDPHDKRDESETNRRDEPRGQRDDAPEGHRDSRQQAQSNPWVQDGQQTERERFPEMEPVDKPPGLWRVNGIGTTVMGRRDEDPETGSYVKTLVFTFLFIPLFAIRAYRVLGAGGDGWYFLGKQPLSGFAKGYNYFVALLVASGIGLVGIGVYTDSPEYRAGEKFEAAQAALQSGEHVEAADKFGDLARYHSNLSEGRTAESQLRKLATTSQEPTLSETARILEIARDAQVLGRLEAANTALEITETRGASDPDGAVALLDVAEKMATPDKSPASAGTDPDDERDDGSEPNPYEESAQDILEKLAEQHPDHVGVTSKLADIHHEAGNREKARKLLEPHRDELGVTEGARILGQIYSRDGKIEEAQTLLEPYVQKHIGAFRKAATKYQTESGRARERVASSLEMGTASKDFYRKYENASQDERKELLLEYAANRRKNDASLARARKKLGEQSHIVPVALDLGMIYVDRAQNHPHPDKRRTLLEKARTLFGDIRVAVAGSPQYRLYFAKVHYWLGEHDKGRGQLDAALENAKRSPEILVQAAQTLREVGSDEDARKYAEEAFGKAEKNDIKNAAATVRALLASDVDESIEWLRKCEEKDPRIRASLQGRLARQAMQNGQRSRAIRHHRKEIELYDSQPENSTTLNNSALAYFRLYAINGEQRDFDRGARRLEKAVELAPSSSVVVWNAAATYLRAGIRDIVGRDVDLSASGREAGLYVIPFLYDDDRSRDEIVEKLEAHPAIEKAATTLERARMLSPKSPRAYRELVELYLQLDDVESLKTLLGRLRDSELDLSAHKKSKLEFIRGTSDNDKLPRLESGMDEVDTRLKSLSAGSQPRAFALAATERVQMELSRHLIDGSGDVDHAVSLAKKAHRAAPSSATRATLTEALAFRVLSGLATRNATIRQQWNEYRRTLSSRQLLAVVLSDDTVAADVRSHDDVGEIRDLVERQVRAFPDHVSPTEWALLEATKSSLAESAKTSLIESERARLKALISSMMSPYHGSSGYSLYWYRVASGEPQKARAVLEQYEKRGVPLPK